MRVRGHMDLGIVLWIMLILALVGVAAYLEKVHGLRVVDLWARLPGQGREFLIALPVSLAVSLVGGAASMSLERGVTERADVIVLEGRAWRTAGLVLLPPGAVCLGYGWHGTGWPWGVILALGALAALGGLVALGLRQCLVFGAERIVFEVRLAGIRFPVQAWARPWPEPSLRSWSTGGAFGQPYRAGHDVQLGPQRIATLDEEAAAGALRDRIAALLKR